MTSHERFRRMFAHQEADRIPLMDYPWGETVERWRREGMPVGANWLDYFGFDRVAHIMADTSPRYPVRVVEETDEYVIRTTPWGCTTRNFKHTASTPEFLDYTIVNADTWREAKARMTPTRDRVDWKWLEANYKRLREEGCWIQGHLWFGFDVAHSWAVGTERFLMALAEDPEWCIDMFNHYLDMGIALLDMVWDEGCRFDSVFWPDDMGYKFNQFFSVPTYRAMLKPVHRRAVEWAHAKGVQTHLHSCGDIRPFVPELIDIGVDCLNPLEVKAGVDPIALKRQYGKDLVLHGGFNALNWADPAAMEAEVEEKIPILKENGGYIFASDHSIPSSIGFADFTRIISRVKELGTY